MAEDFDPIRHMAVGPKSVRSPRKSERGPNGFLADEKGSLVPEYPGNRGTLVAALHYTPNNSLERNGMALMK